ncbi:hypothetical protein Acr_29g0007360 [Actinidia rufa]|uniref:Uncharacterized protein n=1 Tax=Actinidia rufa TaxID=165716 RepID=A0A7J0HG15_9ERIC|nr:hypothetical protein Acr_29g0007360 [Actinidia rufa]
MHLRSRLLPRQSTSSPFGNRAGPMTNTGHAPNLKGIHREMHGIAEQIRIMNEINAHLVQHLATNNPPLATAPVLEEADRSPHSHWSDLDAWINAINTGVNAPITIDAFIRQTEPPFIERVMRLKISSRFKLPSQLGVYEGKTDPMDHLDSYKNLMMLQGGLYELKSWLRPSRGGEVRMNTRKRSRILSKQSNTGAILKVRDLSKMLRGELMNDNLALLLVELT